MGELRALPGGKGQGRAKSLEQAVAADDAAAEAKALRAILAARIVDPKTSAVAVAALTKQFRELGGAAVVPPPAGAEGGEEESAGVSRRDDPLDTATL